MQGSKAEFFCRVIYLLSFLGCVWTATISTDVISLDTVQGGDSKVIPVTLTNNWDEPFIISAIETGCSCIEHDIEKSELSPNESGQLYFIVNFGLMSTEIKKIVKIAGRGKLTGKIQDLSLEVRAKIKSVFSIDHNSVTWNPGEQSEKRTVRTAFVDENDCKITGISLTNDSNINARMLTEIPARSAVLELSIKNPTLMTRETISILTNHPGNSFHNITIFCVSDPVE
jgi:hypothetical protein